MRSSNKFAKEYCFLFFIAIITLVAFIFRVLCCFWGKPLQLHPDEKATVKWAIDMLQRHSWEAHIYDRPDHFEIKCDAILFTIVSWIKYHKPAYEAFEEHKMAFYMLARFYTTLFGTVLIPLSSMYVGCLVKAIDDKYKKLIQLITAVLIAFSSIFVQHSAYATPDIVLTFWVLLFSYGMMRYCEDGNKRYLFMCIIIIGIGVTIKYPAAILCIPLAIMVIYRAYFIDNRLFDIVKYGFISIGIIFLTIFVLAPNLITDINAVYVNFVEEARPNHLGADGLGFSGNLKYYLQCILSTIGSITILPFAFGLIYIFTHKSRKWLSLLVGLIYWICISVLSLHWLRWGIPIYQFYIIIVAIGIIEIMMVVERFIGKHRIVAYIGRSVAGIFTIMILLNVILSGMSIVKFSLLPDTRLVAQKFLDENGITTENTLYEGYTPFAPSSAKKQVNAFIATEEGVKVGIQNATKKYFLMSNSFKGRYLAEPDRYSEQCAIYNGLEETYEIIYREGADGNYELSENILDNIINSWKYLTGKQTATGNIITVYDMNPKYLTVQTNDGQYLSAISEENGAGILLSDEAYQWVKYDDRNEMYTLLSGQSGLALDVIDGNFSSEGKLQLWSASGDVQQQWYIVKEDNFYYFIGANNMALTYEGNSVMLSEYTKNKNQKWYIREDNKK